MHCTASHPARDNLSWTGVVLNALVVRTASVLAHVHRALRLYARPSAHCGKQEPEPQVSGAQVMGFQEPTRGLVPRRRVEDLGRHVVRRTHCQAHSTLGLVSCSTQPSWERLPLMMPQTQPLCHPPFVTDESFSHHPAARFRTLSHVASAPNPARAQRGGRPTHTRSRNVPVELPKPKGERQTPSYTPSQLKRGSPRHAHSHLPRRRAVGLAVGTPTRACNDSAMLFSEACVRPGAKHITFKPMPRRYGAHASPEPAVVHPQRQRHELSCPVLATAARIDGAADTIWARPIPFTHARSPAPRVRREAHRAPSPMDLPARDTATAARPMAQPMMPSDRDRSHGSVNSFARRLCGANPTSERERDSGHTRRCGRPHDPSNRVFRLLVSNDSPAQGHS